MDYLGSFCRLASRPGWCGPDDARFADAGRGCPRDLGALLAGYPGLPNGTAAVLWFQPVVAETA